MSAIDVSGLVRRYGDHAAVNGLDLTVATGECVAILGPNGAGKTTVVEILEGPRRRSRSRGAQLASANRRRAAKHRRFDRHHGY